MFLLGAITLVAVHFAHSPHAARPARPGAPRTPSTASVESPRELVVEAPPLAAKVEHETSPVIPVVVSAKPEAPDFRGAVAHQLEALPICRRAGGPEGPGLAEVTYLPDGTARISLSNNYSNTSVGACVARRFGNAARIFDGQPVTLKVRFEV